MTLECPLCHKSVDTHEFKITAGTRGGFECPACKQMLHFAQPHAALRRTLSLLVSLVTLLVFRVRSIPLLIGGSLVLWAPVQLGVNAYCVRRMPLGLKPWQPPPQKSPLWKPDVHSSLTRDRGGSRSDDKRFD